MPVRKPECLLAYRIGNFLSTVSDVDAPEASHTVKVPMTCRIGQPDALAARHDDSRSSTLVIRETGKRMKTIAPIEVGQVDVLRRRG